jgi:pSer/pThr/pTyr-binding forkhead associated (FHA) protein
MGEVYDAPRSTRDHSTREVFIENVGIVASQTPILATRVWPLIDTKNAMTTPGISLGRASINDVVITEYALSKGHCRFNLDETKTAYVLRDLNSTNGTYLNGEKLAPNMAAPVKHLDIIILGRYQFQYFTSGGFLRELIDRAQTSS